MSASTIFFTTSDTRVWCHEYGTEAPPILSLHSDGAGLSISAAKSQTTADRIAFARSLARAANAYLSAMEHYAAAEDPASEIAKAA